MERERLDSIEWQGSIEGWAAKLARKALWRVDMDFADLLQEFAMKYCYVREKYPEVVEPRHFMALFKTSCVRHLHEMAAKKRDRVKLVLVSPAGDGEEDSIIEVAADRTDYFGWADLRIAIERAPELVKTICRKALSGKGGHLHLPKGGRETHSAVLERLAGVSGNHLPALKDWFRKELGFEPKIS